MFENLTGRDYLSGLDNRRRVDHLTHEGSSDSQSVLSGETDDIHPSQQVSIPSLLSADPVIAVERFAQIIASMTEEDFGDWARRANTYWWQLRSELLESKAASKGVDNNLKDIETELFQIHKIIQYCPDFRVLETQRQVIKIALKLIEKLSGHRDLDLTDFQVSISQRSLPQAPPWTPMRDNPEPTDLSNYFQNDRPLGINGELI